MTVANKGKKTAEGAGLELARPKSPVFKKSSKIESQ
jgi:hypothetical protein